MRWATLFITSTLLCSIPLSSTVSAKEQLLIVSTKGNLTKLSKPQLRQIYLENGIHYHVKPINLRSGSKLRAVFNTKVIGLTEARLQSYWAQMRFTGRVDEPIEFDSIENLIQFLEKNIGYIAYLPADIELPSSVQVIDSINY